MRREEQLELVNKQLVEAGDMDLIAETFSSEYIAHAGSKSYNGHTFIKRYIKQLRKAIPDIKVVKVEFLANGGDSITWQRTFRGTHKHDMRGIPASMNKVKWYEIVVSRFEDGKIVEEWLASDLAAQLMLKQ